MRRIILCALVAAACGDDGRPAMREDAGTPDAPPQGLIGCLDTAELPMAPNGQLPCDLVPPGLRP
jgi:hypothetical protein